MPLIRQGFVVLLGERARSVGLCHMSGGPSSFDVVLIIQLIPSSLFSPQVVVHGGLARPCLGVSLSPCTYPAMLTGSSYGATVYGRLAPSELAQRRFRHPLGLMTCGVVLCL